MKDHFTTANRMLIKAGRGKKKKKSLKRGEFKIIYFPREVEHPQSHQVKLLFLKALIEGMHRSQAG